MMDKELKFYDAYIDNEYMYFSCQNFNGLFRIKKGAEEAEFLGNFDNEELWQSHLHIQIIKKDNQLYFIPYFGRGISIYNLETKEFDFIDISRNNEIVSYSQAIPYNDGYILIPRSTQYSFIYFDIKKHLLSELSFINLEIKKKFVEKILYIDTRGSIVINECLRIAFWDTPYFATFDLCKKSVRWMHFGKEKLANIIMHKNNIWLTTRRGNVLKWDPKTNLIYDSEVIKSEKQEFFCCVEYENVLFLLPCVNQSIWYFDEIKGKWVTLEDYMPAEFIRKTEAYSLMVGCKEENGKLLFFPNAGNGIVIFETRNKKMSLRKICADDKTIQWYKEKKLFQLSKQFGAHEIVVENENMQLQTFIEYLNRKG